MAEPRHGQEPDLDVRALGGLILEVHRAGREAPPDAFQPMAIDLIRAVIPFDSAWWGNAAAEPMEIHRVRVFNCDESILGAYLPWMDQDFFRAALMAQPGVTINLADLVTRARYVRSALYRGFGRRFRVEWSLGTLLVEPLSSLYEFLTLWRHDGAKPFTETDRKAKELLMPHLADAHRVARLRCALGEAHRQATPWAVSDERGFLRETSPRFIEWLHEHWPQWRGSRLPEPLLASVCRGLPLRTGGQKLVVTRRADLRLLEVRQVSALDGMSRHEYEIVVRYARGHSHAQIAAALGLSRAAVRGHIARCYRKLAVSNKAELALRIAQDGAP
ncbi:MAG: LuxR C-terminal-related transcriptional regulator [Rhodocyclaceae bacterium]